MEAVIAVIAELSLIDVAEARRLILLFQRVSLVNFVTQELFKFVDLF